MWKELSFVVGVAATYVAIKIYQTKRGLDILSEINENYF